jgi:energy-coupling factor transport system ATP-binding protein
MIRLNNISVAYEGGQDNPSHQNALDNISLTIEKGECIVLCGKSGCGKTTITRLLNGLIPMFYPAGLQGEVILKGKNAQDMSIREISQFVGSVFQNPKSQFFNVDTTGELAFGCENQGLSRDAIHHRLKQSVQDFSLEKLINRDIFRLSGGEKQRIACGSIYAMNPDIYVLDEPSSNLDLQSIGQLHNILKQLKSQGKTIIISEHRLHYLKELATRYIFLEDGKILNEYRPAELEAVSEADKRKMGLRTQDFDQIDSKRVAKQPLKEVAMDFQQLLVRRNKQTILKMANLQIRKNTVLAIVGENGVGKSCLIACVMGFLNYQGDILLNGSKKNKQARQAESFLVMQDVNSQLFARTVFDEVLLGVKSPDLKKAHAILDQLGLSALSQRHPASLSGGQKQRLAIASAIYGQKKYLFFDEPTSGLDRQSMEAFCQLILENREVVDVTVIITHDLELILGCADEVLLLNRDLSMDLYPLDEAGIKKTRTLFINLYEKQLQKEGLYV